MERMVVEYLANALWQLPALALGAWALLRMWRPGPAAQHRVWLAILGLGLLLPLRGAVRVNENAGFAAGPAARIHAVAAEPAVAGTPSAVFSGEAMDWVGEPGGLVLGRRTDGNWLDFAGRYLATLAGATRLHRVRVSAAAARWAAGLWLMVALWGLLRIARAWRVARGLVAGSREVALGEQAAAALLECSRRLGVGPPAVRESDEIAGPVVVGAFAPVLLWPEGMARCSEDDLRAALCHELAHVRRRDYAMNLLCEAAAVPLKWHPAARGVERRIRATREMACDAMAAEAMESETVYAECLMRLARSIVGGGLVAEAASGAASGSAAAGLFNGNVMEERVMRLTRGRTAMSLRARVVRGAAGAAAMMAAIAVAGAFHVVPAMAQGTFARSAGGNALVAGAAQAAQATPRTPSVAPAPAQMDTPASPAPPPVPPAPAVPKVAAMPAVPKVPAAPAVPKVRAHQSHGSRPVVVLDGRGGDLTPAERARMEKQLDEAQRKIAAATAKIDSAEFRRQMEEAQRQALQAATLMNSVEFKQRMADVRKQVAEATAKLNSPEFKKQMAEAQAAALGAQTMLNSAEFQRKMADAQKQAATAVAKVNGPEFQKQMAEATARLNSPEFKRQIEEAVRAAAKANSAEFQEQMAEARKQVADAMAKMQAEQGKK